ncbi:MAG: guanylate kinase [Clostridiales bacterium]|nr:guanylate kinase [Clostridiales bacterium]
MTEKGKLIVVSGPSGAGKSTVIARVMKDDPDVAFSVSATTRAPRKGEVEGRDYHFVDRAFFEKMIENAELLEHAQYVGDYYGTPKLPAFENIEAGKSVIFDVEVQGAAQIKLKCPEAVLIFIIPSDFSQIEKRLRGRNTDSEEKIARRIETARREYAMAEKYDYIVINDDPDTAANEMKAIITAEKCRASYRKKYLNEVSL